MHLVPNQMANQTPSRLAGGLIGLVGGIVAAIFAVGATAGFLWLFVFGDNPWPSWRGWILGAVGLVVLIAGIVLGVLFGARLRPSVALPLAGIVLLLAASAVAIKVNRDRAESSRTQKQDAAIVRLSKECHKIAAIRPVLRADKSGWDVAISFGGSRAGAYKLRMALRRGAVEVLSRESQIDLPTADQEMTFPFELREVINAYEGRVFTRGARNLAIEETVELEYTLEPLLTAAESAQMGANELQNLRLGYSPLVSKKDAELRVQFAR